MTPHHAKVVQLTEDYAKLTRDDRSRYEQIVWALRGEMRRLPSEHHQAIADAMWEVTGEEPARDAEIEQP